MSLAIIFLMCMVVAGISDLVSLTISNALPFVLGLVAFLGLLMVGAGWENFASHLAIGVGVLLITFCLFAVGAMGGGDAKLIAATALWMGPTAALAQYLVWSALLGGMLTLVLLALRYSPLAPAAVNTTIFRHMADKRAGIPYGIALGGAGLLAFPNSPLGQWALAAI